MILHKHKLGYTQIWNSSKIQIWILQKQKYGLNININVDSVSFAITYYQLVGVEKSGVKSLVFEGYEILHILPRQE